MDNVINIDWQALAYIFAGFSGLVIYIWRREVSSRDKTEAALKETIAEMNREIVDLKVTIATLATKLDLLFNNGQRAPL